jgi:hypothetical protein
MLKEINVRKSDIMPRNLFLKKDKKNPFRQRKFCFTMDVKSNSLYFSYDDLWVEAGRGSLHPIHVLVEGGELELDVRPVLVLRGKEY